MTQTVTVRHICDILKHPFSKYYILLEHLAADGVVVCAQEAQMLLNKN
jgi:hypothetical protein